MDITKLNWLAPGIPQTGWAIALILVIGGINYLMVRYRYMREFGIVGIWRLIAVAVQNWETIPQ